MHLPSYAAGLGVLLLSGLSAALALHETPPADSPVRLPFVQRQRWGYLDDAGRVMIAPRFATVLPFREGLAAVRENGRYGYIDAAGTYVLPPAYDYATAFDHGYASVWQDSTQLLIDRTGRVQFRHTYLHLTPVLNDPEGPYIIVTTRHQNQGVVDMQGRVLVDTLYSSISLFQEGRAVVKTADRGTAVVDRHGRLVVPPGRYDDITDFQEGLAKVDIPAKTTEDDSDNGFIDRDGRLVLRLPARQLRVAYDVPGFRGGVVTVQVRRKSPLLSAANLDDDDQEYASLIDQQGRLLFHNEHLTKILPFDGRLSFAKTRTDEWVLLDKTGRILPLGPFTDVYFNYNRENQGAFTDGLAFVRTAQGVGVVDSSGRIVRPYQPWQADEAMRKGPYLEYTEVRKPERYLAGRWAPLAGTRLPPRFAQVSMPVDTASRLLAVILDGRPAYVTPTGRLVWQQAVDSTSRLNIDHRQRTYYTVASPDVRYLRRAGGWAPSGNLAHAMKQGQFAAHALSLRVDTQATATYAGAYRGYPLYLANSTGDTLVLDAQDSRLDIRLQALNRQGRWQDVEYLPSSWCGNSYHLVFLAPGQFWQLVAPAYEGEQHTRLRAVLHYRQKRTSLQLISNEFAGSINPGQFWRKAEYMPTGIMDPYLD